MDGLLLVTRMTLALVFAVAGFTKLVDRYGTEKAAADFGVPPPFARPIATLLPLAEFAAALLLMFRGTAWWGSLLALALLLLLPSRFLITVEGTATGLQLLWSVAFDSDWPVNAGAR